MERKTTNTLGDQGAESDIKRTRLRTALGDTFRTSIALADSCETYESTFHVASRISEA